MSYITSTQLHEGPGMPEELAQPFGVEVALMSATIAGADRSTWSAEEIAAADAALLSIQNTIARAAAEMNAYLAKRGYSLPLSAVQFPVLTSWCRNIFRYHHQPQRDRTNEETGRIERDYRATLRALTEVAKGVISLGADDPLDEAGKSAGSPGYVEPCREFTRESLRDY